MNSDKNIPHIEEEYDVVVVGAGHAGCEAALACARLGLETIIFTVSVDSCFTPAPSKEQVDAITFTSDFKKSIRESWGLFDIIGSLVVIGLCAAFYAYFW